MINYHWDKLLKIFGVCDTILVMFFMFGALRAIHRIVLKCLYFQLTCGFHVHKLQSVRWLGAGHKIARELTIKTVHIYDQSIPDKTHAQGADILFI